MAFTPITGGGSFTRQNIEQINDNFARLFAYVTTGRSIYCNPAATGTLASGRVRKTSRFSRCLRRIATRATA